MRDGPLSASAKTIPSIWWEPQNFQDSVGGVVSCVSNFLAVLISSQNPLLLYSYHTLFLVRNTLLVFCPSCKYFIVVVVVVLCQFCNMYTMTKLILKNKMSFWLLFNYWGGIFLS